MVEKFIESFATAPNEIILDFDPTEDKVHGHQENRHYHGYYKSHCFLPLHVFCGEQLLISYLRPSNIDGAKHAWAILSLLVKRLRLSCLKVKIIFRGDSAFCRNLMLSWCDKNNVTYIVGIAKNNRLKQSSKDLISLAECEYKKSAQKQKLFGDFHYAAKTWKHTRRIIVKAEHTDKGARTHAMLLLMKEVQHKQYMKINTVKEVTWKIALNK